MIRLKIDHIDIEAIEGTTVLEAARQAGIVIPSMCHLKGYGNHPSCMVCLVKDRKTGSLTTSCSLKVTDGMDMITSDEEVQNARCQALELLMSDHVGDCEAPCSLACPAGMDIPLMNRLIAEGKFTEAFSVVKEDIALPYILGYICPAPCEKACRRKQVDDAVSVCLLKRFTAATNKPDRFQKPVRFSSGRKIAVIGSGPAGLAAAYYSLLYGHSCEVFDKSEEPGGTLRYAIPEEELPRMVIDHEVDLLRSLGAVFHLNTLITEELFNQKIRNQYDAVVLATGDITVGNHLMELAETGKSGYNVNDKNMSSSVPGIFVCGSAIRPHKMAIRSAAQGKTAAMAAHEYLQGKPFEKPAKMFNSRFDKLFTGEFEEYLKESNTSDRVVPKAKGNIGFSADEAIREALRCMHCDCRKKDNCSLRIYADEYRIDRKHYMVGERKAMTKQMQHDLMIYEPEKCIKCGLCVAISSNGGEKFGLAFDGRGFDVTIKAPLGSAFSESLTHTAAMCASSCPTGALSLRSLLLSIILLLTYGLHAQDSWPIYRGNQSLSGASSVTIPKAPKVAWVSKMASGTKSSPVIADNCIYIGSDDGTLHCLSFQGKSLWKFKTPQPIEGAPLVHGNSVYFGTYGGEVFALEAKTGKQRWKFQTEGEVLSSPNYLISGKSKKIIVGSYDYYLYCLDDVTGKPDWKYSTDNYINSTPSIAGNLAVFGGCDGKLHVVDLTKGTARHQINSGTYIASSATLSGNQAFFGDYDGAFYCVDYITKKLIWEQRDGGSFVASPAVSADKVIIGSENRSVYCFNKPDGRLLWKYKTLGKIAGSPVIAGNNVAITSGDGRLYVLDIKTGKQTWAYDMGSPSSSTPAIVKNLMVVATQGGHVFGFTLTN